MCNKRVVEESIFCMIRNSALFVVTIIVRVFTSKIQFHLTVRIVFQGERTIVLGGIQIFFVALLCFLISCENKHFRNKNLQKALKQIGVFFTVCIDKHLTFRKFIYVIFRIPLLNYGISKLLYNSLKSC